MYIQALKKNLSLFLLLVGVHFLISYFLGVPSPKAILAMQFALVFLTFGGHSLILFVNEMDANKLGFTFLAVSTLKMLAAATVVLITVRVLEKPSYLALHFVGFYLVYLFFLAFQVYTLLKKE